jgi:serine/threonine protein phosphatase PrpC
VNTPFPESVPDTLSTQLPADAPPAPIVIACPICETPNPKRTPVCHDCGYHFSEDELAGNGKGSNGAAPPTVVPNTRVKSGRYELVSKINERKGVTRFRGFDRGDDGNGPPVPVFGLREAIPAPPPAAEEAPMATEVGEAIPVEEGDEEDFLPTFEDINLSPTPPAAVGTEILPPAPAWPSLAWEKNLLKTLEQPAMPRVVDEFREGGFDYLVVEIPVGRSLWDAWDDPEADSDIRFGYLVTVAETLLSLHSQKVILEGMRPDHVVITPEGQARLCDLSDLLPLPIPHDAPIKGTLYTAPELAAGHGQVDARADLYSFGAMLYSLHVGRELADVDFDKPGNPKPFIPRYPDIHPAFGRLMTKTFRKAVESRFPTDEAGKEDATGFVELVRTLNVLRRTYDTVRLEVASWTSTGIVRTGNEDAFALIHTTESRQDDLGETALILLCDGMGGYEAGEVAAALAIQVLRQYLVTKPPFQALAGQSPFPTDPLATVNRAEGHAAAPIDIEAVKATLKAALKETNKQVFAASRAPGSKRRGMGCTAEVVFTEGRNVVVGHVGDSRTYHLHEGQLIQITRDQTLVNRLVELGTLSPEEAETHPRRNELQQAIGGQPDVEPGVYSSKMSPGDWILVCSDGLTNHVNAAMLKEMLQLEATSAEMAARRLVNLTNIEGATDNVTVVVIRAT